MNAKPCKRWLRALLPLAGVCFSAQAQLLILQQPLELTNISLGATEAFSVAASSGVTTNLQYQWRRNGVNIPGETNSALTISDIQATSGGGYSAVVSDGVETATSATASLTADVLLEVADDIVLNLISLTSGVLRSSSVGASKLAGEPTLIPGHQGGHPVWFKWTPLFSGIVTFTTAGSDFETMMGAYTGSYETNVVAVPSVVNNIDGAGYHNSRISFNAQALTTYQIAVDGLHGQSGNVVLTWSENITSDTLATFTVVPPADTSVAPAASFTFTATNSSGSLQWYYNGNPTGVTTKTITVNQASDGTIGKYDAQVTSPGGNVTSTRAADLQTCILQDGSTATNSFAYATFLDAAASSSNLTSPTQSIARRSDGGDTRGYSVSQVFSTFGAESEPGEPVVCNQVGGAPEWYAYIAPTNGALYVSTAGSSFNTILGVFVGPGNSFTTLTNIGCGYTSNYQADGQPQIYIPSVPAGQTNFIVVDGEGSASGPVHLFIGVGNPISISAAPQNQAVVAGSYAMFSVTAAGSTPINYAWQFNGTNIPGATNSVLTVTNVRAAQVGFYSVTVSNMVLTTNSTAILSLLAAPTITNQPASEEIKAGNNATFTCLAGGASPLFFQWMDGSVTLPGATNSTLILTNVQSTNAGSFTCVVTNVAGMIVSSNAILTVDTIPVFLTSPFSQTVTSNSSPTLSASASGFPSPAFQWFFNGAPTGVNSNSLKVNNFRPANVGDYWAVASNSAGTATSLVATLMLNSPLRIGPFSFTNGIFQFQLAGVAGSNYIIQTSTNFVTWTPVLTNTTTNGLLLFSATNTQNLPAQFYRAIGH